MRAHRTGIAPLARALLTLAIALLGAAIVSGALWWAWTQAACLLSLRAPLGLPLGDAARGMWQAIEHGEFSSPALGFPLARERLAAPQGWAYLASALALTGSLMWVWVRVRRQIRTWQASSPLAFAAGSLAARAARRGWVPPRTWAQGRDLRRLWVKAPGQGRPYLGVSDSRRGRLLAAEREVQPMVIAPPRAGKSSGYVVPWLLEHRGPTLVLSTKRDVYEASIPFRAVLGRTWVFDPFGTPESACFTPLVPASSWDGAIRTGEALASAAHPDQTNAANEFWDKEAASMLAPLLHAAAAGGLGMDRLIHWLDTRSFIEAVRTLKSIGAHAAADQLEGIERRDERNRETTVMSALNLLRAYRYPQLAAVNGQELTPERFLDGEANTAYVIAAGHDQDALRPVVLALVSSIYEAAVRRARSHGALDPPLFILLDEAANIAPVRNLASWLSQCGDHGIVIATIWQSIAQIDQRYGRAARDAICAASTAQVFIPPLAEPTTSGYLSGLLGEELVANASASGSATATLAKTAQAPWLRQVPRGRAVLIYRDLPPAVVRAPGWFEDPRFAAYRREHDGQRGKRR
ncbi:MAG TPA: type IV secretory system conjugative DNA transfer family protein [Solirubrobacteraceae bacterium]|nr:type IV secretory system conjugative DNA transfer family protein [Solirubrobacteraceae bacterium]